MEPTNVKKRASEDPTANGNGVVKKALLTNGGHSVERKDFAGKTEIKEEHPVNGSAKGMSTGELLLVPEEYKANGLKAVTFRIVNGEEDMSLDSTAKDFHPEYVYQYFKEPGDEEAEEAVRIAADPPVEDNEESSNDASEAEEDEDDNGEDGRVILPDEIEGLIAGYKGLAVKMFFTAATLKPFVSVNFTDALPPARRSVPDIVQAIESVYGHKVMTTTDAMLQAVKEDLNFVPVGRKIHGFTVDDKSSGEKSFEVFEVGHESQEVGYPARFSEYLALIQPVLQWFIYASNIVTTDSSEWLHYFLYEKTAVGGYHLVGYTSVYRFTVWPKAEEGADWVGDTAQRCRIAQFLILPPYQKRGYGARLLKSVINRLEENPKTYEITVEDASPQFQKLYDTVTTYLLRDYISRDHSMALDYTKFLPAETLKALHKHVKFSPKVLKFAFDVLSCMFARNKGQEAVKAYYENVTAVAQEKTESMISFVERAWRRVKGGYYEFSEDVTCRDKQLLMAGWELNYRTGRGKWESNLTPEKIGRAVEEMAERTRNVAKRIDELF